ncbi:MAG: tRNA (N(6)-L-threonylcarbamoyladenosine(37)-C(2))-methylthiotransferase [Candidatus Methanomethylophilaceae archaeon]|nr:tRNA (N(6)-L-threonylcarbamoyladenosine(37)-C(2))-methylthiotransferase [Candidatus Methanomethylophilaceae archaeon]
MKYFVESYGCTMNYGEGEQLSKKMDALGHVRVDSVKEADIVILNTCTVVETTEKNMIRRMGDLKKAGKKVIVTGCMAKVQPKRIEIRLPDSVIISPDRYNEFSDLVSDEFGCFDPVDSPSYGMSAILPIAQGCLGNCSYCITRFARGALKSYDENDLIKEFNAMIDAGAKEVLVTAQDTACYGRDTGMDLPQLIRRFLEKEGDYRLRIGMMNPNNLKPIVDDLLDTMEDRRVYRFLHIPVQSGSDTVLKNMRRRYTADEFLSMVEHMRARYPDISISTDMISGFPGETDEDHRKSVELIRKLHADTVNITRFSVRPGTDAAKMKDQIQGNVSKERSTELTDTKMDVEYNVNKNLVGRRFRVLVTEKGKPGTVITRTENYRPVGIDEDIPLGTFLEVEVTDCASTYVTGKRV